MVNKIIPKTGSTIIKDEYEEMFERIDREADGEVYVREVLDFLRSMASDLDQVNFRKTVFFLRNKFIVAIKVHDILKWSQPI